MTTLGVVVFNAVPAAGNMLFWAGKFFYCRRLLKGSLDQIRQIAPDFSDIATLD